MSDVIQNGNLTNLLSADQEGWFEIKMRNYYGICQLNILSQDGNNEIDIELDKTELIKIKEMIDYQIKILETQEKFGPGITSESVSNFYSLDFDNTCDGIFKILEPVINSKK